MYKMLITTSNDRNILKLIAKECILSERISPCTHIIDNINSLYIWKGKLVDEKEYMLLIKCKVENSNKVKTVINAHHNYDIPEIISADFDVVSKKYKEWFNKK